MINILFLCVANSARSQMAEGLAREILAGVAQVNSAGSQPGKVNPMAVEVLKEIDIDISHQKSKSVDSINKDTIDLVISLCAEEVCPVYLGNVKRLHWPLPDPVNSKYNSDEQRNLFRQVRDELKDKIQRLKEDIKSWNK